MTKKILMLVISVCSFLFLAGASTYEELLVENQNNIQKISPGLTKEQVVEIMGTKEAQIKSTHVSNPYKRDFFTQGKDDYEILYYLTRRYPAFTAIKQSQATPIVIKNGKVIGLGIDAVKSVKGSK